MLARFHHWLHNLTFHDPLKQRQAALMQIMLLSLVGISCIGATIPFIAAVPLSYGLVLTALILANVPVALVALIILRRHHFTTSVLLTTAGLILILTTLLLFTSIEQGGALLFAFAIPITLAGLLAGRRALILTVGMSIFGVSIVTIMLLLRLPLAGALATGQNSTVGMLGGFVITAAVIGLFMDRFSIVLRQALVDTQTRQQELEGLRESLEYTVNRRTTELRRVLDEVQARAAEQERLLAENEQQRLAIRELSVPVLPVSTTTMVMPLVGTLDSERLRMLEERALHAIQRSATRQVLLDITGVPVIDSQVAAGILRLVQAARLLGAEVMLVGVRPEVAQAIVGLGLDLGEMPAYSDLHTALRHTQ